MADDPAPKAPADNGERRQRGTDARADARCPIELKVEYKRLNTFFADYTKNISRGGTFIKTGRPLPIGTEFLFKLFVPGRDTPLTIHGEVQRIVDAGTDTEAGMAIKFVYREGDPQAEISRIVENMMTESFGPKLSAKLMARRAADKSEG